jgi:hypothetical protein
MPSLLVFESPWNDELESGESVGPFLMGLKDALKIKVISQRFNGRDDLVYYLRKFSEKRSRYSHCYIACHGTLGRLQPLLRDVNAATIADACRGARGRGFIIGACSFGNRRTATAFLRKTKASFVAGYTKDVPWMDSMLVDLAFLTYLLGGRCRTKRESGGNRTLVAYRDGSFSVERSRDPLKVARWLYEDFPLSKTLGFVVHRRSSGRGPWRLLSSKHLIETTLGDRGDD